MTDAIQKAREALETALNSIGDLIVVNGQVSWAAVARIQDELIRDVAALAALDAETEVKVTRRIDILREWFGGDRYARDYEYLDANFGEHADRIVGYLARARSPGGTVMSGLANCPFCGGAAIILKDHEKLGLYVACQNCFVASRTGKQAEVIAAWNHRAATPADVGEEPVAWQWRYRYDDGKWGDWQSERRPDADDLLTNNVLISEEIRPLYSATALERVTRERDEARATLDEVCLSSRQEWQRATSAEAKLAEARKVIEELRVASEAFLALAEDGSRLHKAHFTSGRFLEETK